MRQQQAEQAPISEVMHLHPHYVTEQQLVSELVSLLLDQGIGAAPVVDANGKPIGLVSKTDVVREIKEGHRANRQRSRPMSSLGGMRSAYPN